MEKVNHPAHYNEDPSGVECITVAENWTFNLGNCLKYLWRHGKKSSVDSILDLEKAKFYIQREIDRIKSMP